MFDDFLRVGSALAGDGKDWFQDQCKKVRNVVASANWPPADFWVDENDKSYNIEVAVAGYTQDQIEMSFKEDSIVLSFGDESVPEKVEQGRRYLYKGIKRPSDATVSYFIDPQFWDKEKISASLKDGMLVIKVDALPEPIKDVKKITINVT
jgi:HSP20 family molecular chaperone IbpA